MSLLREIQSDAADSSKPLADLLRKCLVLAYRLGHEEFKKWVEAELNSCPDAKDVPPNRAAHAESDGVRSKALDFALEIEAIAPDAGEAKPGTRPVADERVTRIFNRIIRGGTPAAAAGAHHFSRSALAKIHKGDVDSLLRFFESEGISDEDCSEAAEAIRDDPRPENPDHLGSRVKGWIGEMISKTGDGWDVATAEGARILIEAIRKYYGF